MSNDHGCNCKSGATLAAVLAFLMKVENSTTSTWRFVPTTPWMPAFGAFRGSMRLLAEQSNGLDMILSAQTAGARYDRASTLDDPIVLGSVHGTEGDSPPDDVVVTITNKAWMRLGYSVRVAGGGPVGIASCGVQLSLPSERPALVAGPGVINVYDNPVTNVYTEVFASEWMSFYSLQSVQAMYDSFNADASLRYTVVVQSVATDPTMQAPVEDTVLAPVTGNTTGVASINAFPNAEANKSQVFRIVIKADNNGAANAARGRIWFAASAQYK